MKKRFRPVSLGSRILRASTASCCGGVRLVLNEMKDDLKLLSLCDRTYSVHIQGCRTNQYEGEAIAALLEKAGGIHSQDMPDITVIVSCTITAAADRKRRKLIRRPRRETPFPYQFLVVLCPADVRC